MLIITPVQHGLAVFRAGARPAAVRSRAHATLGLLSIAATILFFPAAVAWQTWSFLLPAPVGFIVGLRNMTYAGRQTASSDEVRREHLTSMITAGIALYTAFFVLSATRWPTFVRSSFGMPFVWLAPTAIGLLAIAWLRRKTSGVFLPRT